MRKNASLLNVLKTYQATLSQAEYLSFEKEVDRMLVQYFQHLANIPSPIERGRAVHALIDEQVAAVSSAQLGCKKGCAACCHFEVEVTAEDAAILAESVENGMTIDHERMKKLAGRDRHDAAWMAGRIPANRCLFLGEDDACRNYSNRPAVCRKVIVTSHPIECENVGGQPLPVVMPIAEIILSAAISLPSSHFGALPKMLEAALASKKIEA